MGKAVAAESSSQLGFILHPLPLLNISDYYTRAQLIGATNHVGILFGTRTEREVSVENAFEIIINDGKVDPSYLRNRIDLYKTTFPSQDAIGWYHIRTDEEFSDPDEQSLDLHQQMQLHDEFDLSLMLVFNPESTTQKVTSQLPLKAYELVFRDKNVEFAEIDVRVETSDAERIGVDDIMKGEQLTSGQNLDSHLITESNAIRMFYSRLKILRDYIKEVRAGNLQPNYTVLRQINAFMSRLSQEREQNLQNLLDQQELNVLSAGLLAAVTKGEHAGIDISAKRMVNLYTGRGKHEERLYN